MRREVNDLAASGHDGDRALDMSGVDVFLHHFVDTLQTLGRHSDRLSLGRRHFRRSVPRFGRRTSGCQTATQSERDKD